MGGIITPPLLVGAAANDVRTQQFLISSSLIVSGICTVIHCIQLKIPFTGGRLYYGTGVPTGFVSMKSADSWLQRQALNLYFFHRYALYVCTLWQCGQHTWLRCASMVPCTMTQASSP